MEPSELEQLHGELWSSPVLTRRERRLVTIQCLAFAVTAQPILDHAYAALKSGDLTIEELLEVDLHFAVYCGWPKASNLEMYVRQAWARVQEEAGDEPQPLPMRPTEELGDNDWEARLRRGEQEFADVNLVPAPPRDSPYQHAGILNFVFGHVWQRPGLNRRDRRFVTVACVGVCEAPIPISAHVSSALKSGDISKPEMDELIRHFAAYGGEARAAALEEAAEKAWAEHDGLGGRIVKPAPFRLHRPTTVAEATALFAEYGDDAKVLAGGQSLVPLLALRLTRFEHLVDLNGVAALRGIEREDGALRVGAMVRQAEAERNDDVATSVPLLHRALPHIGHFQIRNRGTVGGSTAHADPASELPAVASALDAEMEVTGPTGARTVAARDFFQSMWTTALEPDEILTAIRYPVWEARCGFAVEEFARRSGDFAIAGVACGVALTPHGTIARVAIALFGMGSTPLRADAAESALLGSPAENADVRGAAAVAASATDPSDDIHGTAAFRRRVATHLTERALTRALEEATSV